MKAEGLHSNSQCGFCRGCESEDGFCGKAVVGKDCYITRLTHQGHSCNHTHIQQFIIIIYIFTSFSLYQNIMGSRSLQGIIRYSNMWFSEILNILG